MSYKRSAEDQDPDYDDGLNTANDQKRLRVTEKDNKDATLRKIEQIIRSQFGIEMGIKEKEIDTIDERLYQAMKMLDQLRACVVSAFYTFENLSENTVANASGRQPPIHPTVKNYLGKAPKTGVPQLRFKSRTSDRLSTLTSERLYVSESVAKKPTTESKSWSSTATTSGLGGRRSPAPSTSSDPTPAPSVKPEMENKEGQEEEGSRVARFKVRKRVVIGNVSKYIPVDKREERDQSTHKWMVYVRGPKEQPNIDDFIKKVWFFLHPSYRPNNLVEVTQPPFHLTRRGWGEFPVRVQLHFRDSRNKRVDVIHTLRLDKSYTGLQTLGAETVVDVLIYRENALLRTGSHRPAATSTTAAAAAIFIPADVGGITIPAEKEPSESDPATNYLNYDSCLGSDRTDGACKLADRRSAESETVMDSRHAFFNDHGSYACSIGGSAVVVKSEPLEVGDDLDDQPMPGEFFGVTSAVKQEMVEEVVVEEVVMDDINGSSGELQSNRHVQAPNSVANRQLNSSGPGIRQGVASVAGFPIHVAPTNPTTNAATSAFIQCTGENGQLFLMPLATFLKLSNCTNNNNSSNNPQSRLLPSATAPAGSVGVFGNATVTGVRPLGGTKKTGPIVVRVDASSASRVPFMNGVVRPSLVNDRWGPRPPTCRTLLNNNHCLHPMGKKSVVVTGKTAAAGGSPMVKRPLPAVDDDDDLLAEDDKKEVRPVDVDSFSSMDDIVRHLVRCCPVVSPNPNRCTHPYCASSFTAFLAWPVGKRRASEWQRAKDVCKGITELVKTSNKWTLQDVWTTRRVITWCRHHGYTPLLPSELKCRIGCSNATELEPDSSHCPSCLSDATELMDNLEKEQQLCALPASEEEILDVETVEVAVAQVPTASPQKPHARFAVAMPSSACGSFVRQTAEQVGVNLVHEEVCQEVSAPAAEEVMLLAVTRFAEDLMRQSLAKAFAAESINNGNPSCIDVEHVTNAILELPQCDFLTGQFLGTKIHRSQLIAKSDFKL